MAELINLNRARKAKLKAEAVARAAENRIKHGRTKQEKRAAEIEAERAKRMLDESERER